MSRFHCACVLTVLALQACEITIEGPTLTDDDWDNDGVDYTLDCDDNDPAVYPGAPELCDEIDNDCNGLVDDNATEVATWFRDADGDGHGDAADSVTICAAPDGYVRTDLDCNDADSNVSPDAVETCDEIDQDCDGVVDEDPVDPPTWYQDADADGFGDPDGDIRQCTAPEGYVSDGTDCDDSDPAIVPIQGSCPVFAVDCGVYESCLVGQVTLNDHHDPGTGVYADQEGTTLDIFVGFTATDVHGSCLGGTRTVIPRVDTIEITASDSTAQSLWDRAGRTHLGPLATRYVQVQAYNDWTGNTQVYVQLEGHGSTDAHIVSFSGAAQDVANEADGCPTIQGALGVSSATGTISNWSSATGVTAAIRGDGEFGTQVHLP